VVANQQLTGFVELTATQEMPAELWTQAASNGSSASSSPPPCSPVPPLLPALLPSLRPLMCRPAAACCWKVAMSVNSGTRCSALQRPTASATAAAVSGVAALTCTFMWPGDPARAWEVSGWPHSLHHAHPLLALTPPSAPHLAFLPAPGLATRLSVTMRAWYAPRSSSALVGPVGDASVCAHGCSRRPRNCACTW